MQNLVLVVLLLLCFTGTSALGTQTSTKPLVEDRAIIQRRRVVLTRSPKLAKEFPYKKRAVVVYPVVSGLSAPVLRRVRSVLDFKNIFGSSLREYREEAWLEEFSYKVNHNGNYLLDITFSQSGSGAYPDEQDKHFLINLKNGNVVKASDAFVRDKFAPLTAMVDQKLKLELKEILESLKDSKSDPEDIRIAGEAQEPLEFKIENLDDFSVSAKGVTFLYDAGYPHVIRALQPNGTYFFSYSELRPYIKRDGPLGQFIQ
jgi:hypothetical protein